MLSSSTLTTAPASANHSWCHCLKIPDPLSSLKHPYVKAHIPLQTRLLAAAEPPSLLTSYPRSDKTSETSSRIYFLSYRSRSLDASYAYQWTEEDAAFVDFDADPRVPLILGRSFLKTGRALIDVYEGELTLCVGKEAVTFNLDQTSRYSSNYDDMTTNRIDVIEMACEEYSQEVLGFSDVIASGNPTPYYDPIVSTSSPTLTPFGDSDFLLEEVDAFLTIEDDPTSTEVDDSYYDPKGDILLLESFHNDDPSLPPPTQGNYFPEIRKELKLCEAKTDKFAINEPSKFELKDLPPHLEYTFLKGDNKFPVIIAKDLSVEEKSALIKVLKSHKRDIAWKL
ncbi:hypothetical protein Tco_0070661, partial [Tanacetum coccineum]